MRLPFARGERGHVEDDRGRPDRAPLVSCIMPTRNRRPFVARTIEAFRQQRYPSTQLIVVDDGEDTVRDLAAADPNVRYIALPSRVSTGQKRNIAVAESDGELIAHWDDDDWYDPRRLEYQLAPLLSGVADMTAVRMSVLYDLLGDSAWLIDEQVYARMFFLGIHTGSLVYRKRLWGPAVCFPAVNLGEDMDFIREGVRRGARLLRLPNHTLFTDAGDAGDHLPLLEAIASRCGALPRAARPICIYVRHATNTWRFVCGEHLDPRAWHRIPPQHLLPPADLAAYRAIAASLPHADALGSAPCP